MANAVHLPVAQVERDEVLHADAAVVVDDQRPLVRNTSTQQSLATRGAGGGAIAIALGRRRRGRRNRPWRDQPGRVFADWGLGVDIEIAEGDVDDPDAVTVEDGDAAAVGDQSITSSGGVPSGSARVEANRAGSARAEVSDGSERDPVDDVGSDLVET